MARRLDVVGHARADVRVGMQLHPGITVLERQHLFRLVEVRQELLVGQDDALLQEPERPQERGRQHLAAPIDPHVQDVVRVEVELDPRAPVGNDARREERLPGGQRLALVVVEEHAGRALELADHHALGPVDDEGALVGHERQLAQIDFLAALLANRPGLGFLVVIEDDEAQRDLQRDREGHAAVVTLFDRVLRLTEVVRVELEQRVVVVVGDRKHRLEDRLQAELLAALRRDVLLQEGLVGALLYLDQVRDLDDRRDLAEILPAAVPALNRSCHILSWGRPPAPALTESLNGSSVPGRAYRTETVAPCSSSFFFISSASAFVTFSFTGFGAPSTRSLASLRPSPVSSRTTLMTWIFFSPAAPRITSNSVFSSAAAAPAAAAPPAPGIAATATGAAADTPQRSWRSLESFAASSSESLSS